MEYIALLDHDDILTPDALYEMAYAIVSSEKGYDYIYSDEDKCDENAQIFYDPNLKPDFNYDYLLSNNYICHFLVMNRKLAQSLGFRPEYDGAQDFDFVLRGWSNSEGKIGHVSKVLYHWRCHSSSTADNPHSKEYAYKAGARAIKDCIDKKGWDADVIPLRHLGFQRICYKKDPFEVRDNLGAMGGIVAQGSDKGVILSGPMTADGKGMFNGVPAVYSGYLHRAVLSAQVKGLDIRSIRLRPELYDLFKEVVGVDYVEVKVPAFRKLDEKASKDMKFREQQWNMIFNYRLLPDDTDFESLSLKLSREILKKGYILLYQPEWVSVWKK